MCLPFTFDYHLFLSIVLCECVLSLQFSHVCHCAVNAFACLISVCHLPLLSTVTDNNLISNEFKLLSSLSCGVSDSFVYVAYSRWNRLRHSPSYPPTASCHMLFTVTAESLPELRELFILKMTPHFQCHIRFVV